MSYATRPTSSRMSPTRCSRSRIPPSEIGRPSRVLGKSYATMLPLLADGSKGIKELRADFDALGGGFDADFAKRADEVGDNLDRMKVLGKNLSITILSAVLPTLVDLSRGVVSLAKPMIAMLKNSQLIKAGAIALGVKGFMALSRAIGPLNLALRGLMFRVLPLVAAFLLFEDALTFLSGGDLAHRPRPRQVVRQGRAGHRSRLLHQHRCAGEGLDGSERRARREHRRDGLLMGSGLQAGPRRRRQLLSRHRRRMEEHRHGGRYRVV